MIDYYPFGQVRTESTVGSYKNDYKFTGKELDTDTDLYYYGARYYDGKIGRFTGEDNAFWAVGTSNLKQITGLSLQQYLSDPQNLNSYSYVKNNPLKYTDPDGQFLVALALAWAVVEVGLSAYDIYDTAKTLFSNSSVLEKTLSVGGLTIGMIAPGGGYGQTSKFAVKNYDNVLKHVVHGSRGGGLHVLENAISQGKKVENLQKIGNAGVMAGKLEGKFKTFFPANWNTKDIENSLKHLENNQQVIQKNNNYIQSSKPYKDVNLEGTIDSKGNITSFYPSSKQNK